MKNSHPLPLKYALLRICGLLRLLLFMPCLHLAYSAEKPVEGIVPDINTQVTVVLKAKQEATLGAQVDGQVKTVSVDFGDTFQKDNILLLLDDTVYASALKKAEITAKAASSNYEMSLDLFKRGDNSELDKINAERDKVLAAETVKIARKDFASCTITAPFDGRVVRILVNEHESVQKNQPLMKIVNDKVLVAHFILPEKLFKQAKAGQKMSLYIPAVQKNISAKISHIASVFDSASKTFEVHAEIDNSRNEFRVGMTGIMSLQQFE